MKEVDNMTYQQARDYIDSLKGAGMQMGLARMEAAMAALGHPERSLRTVHIAGTNGKGSVARMIQAMLTAGGVRTGLYASPAVTGVRDTMTIDGAAISQEAFAACASAVRQAVPSGLSEFEFLTVLTFYWFAQQKVDMAVVECGLGGLTDATNVLPPPLCAVLTPIGLDHTAILGDTVEKIARQKCGIAKAPCDIVCAPSMDEEALAVIMEQAAKNGQTVYLPSAASAPLTNESVKGISFTYENESYSLSLHGTHQRDNALTALTVLDCLRTNGIAVSSSAAREALSAVTMPCRQEVLHEQPLLLIDGAHNPQGVAALTQTLQALCPVPPVLVLGMLRDKDVDTCVRLLAPLCRAIVCCTPSGTPRALPAEELAASVSRCHAQVSAVPSPAAALDAALAAAGEFPVVAAGSFYTAAPIRRYWLEQNRKA